MKQIYLIKSHLKQELIDYLTSSCQYLMNVEIMDIEQFINNHSIILNTYDIYQNLGNYYYLNPKEDLSTFKDLEKYKKLFAQYNVDYHKLDIIDDIKECLDDMGEYNYQGVFNFDKKLNNIHIFDGNYNAFETKVKEYLISKGAKLFSFKQNKKSYIPRYKPCLTPRHEIETLCQYIHANEDIDINKSIIYYTNNMMLPLYESVLDRYDIPYHFDTLTNNLAIKFIALYDFYKEPSIEHYLNIIKLNIFGFCEDNLLIYLKNHLKEDDLLDDLKNLNINSYYVNLADKANLIHKNIYPILKEMLKIKDLKELVVHIYNLIKEDSEEGFNLKNFIEENIDNLNSTTLPLFIDQLHNLSIKDNRAGIKLSTLKDYYNYDHYFVLDANNKDLLKPESYEGIINEQSLLNTDISDRAYRYDLALKHLSFLFKKDTIFFNNLTSLEGKESEAAVLIENLPQLDFEMIENEYQYYHKHHLCKELVSKYLFNDGKLYASVSSLEKYQQCQYSYFLNYILKLYGPFKIELNAAYVGSLLHSLLEDLINENGKFYYLSNDDRIKELLNKKMQDLYLLYPNQKYQIDVIKELFLDAIKLEFRFLDKYENSNDFIPKFTEYKFDLDYLNNLHLKGSIDRIDENNDSFQIIDYKTSDHNISLNSLQKGLQLQLITYFLIYHGASLKEPSGFYYLNLNHVRDDVEYYTYDKYGLKGVIDNHETNFISSHRLSGINIDGKINEYYKIPSSKALKQIEIDDLKQANEIILSKIVNKIKSGLIDINPSKGACDYCIYKAICNYHGYEHDKEVLYLFDKEEYHD